MIDWLTADAGASNWAVLAIGVAAMAWAGGLGLALVRVGALRRELDEVESYWRVAESNETVIRERLARARAALDGKDDAKPLPRSEGGIITTSGRVDRHEVRA